MIYLMAISIEQDKHKSVHLAFITQNKVTTQMDIWHLEIEKVIAIVQVKHSLFSWKPMKKVNTKMYKMYIWHAYPLNKLNIQLCLETMKNIKVHLTSRTTEQAMT